MADLKTCSKCKIPKALSEFYADKSAPSGYRSDCKECKTSALRESRSKNPQKRRDQNRQYRLKNREALREKTKRWFKKNPDKVRIYRRKKRLKSKYGITIEALHTMIRRQGNKCLVCLRRFSDLIKPVVDHCHATNAVRGILCDRCNVAEGAIRSAANAIRLSRYMDSFSIFNHVRGRIETTAIEVSTNIHEYLERINAPAPPVDEQSLKDALANVIWCPSVEEAAAIIINGDN
jgi:hypothetical protein